MEIEYNSQRENLTIAEYGRHVQNLINHAKTIEDKDERQRFTEGVIYLMYQMNPTAKHISDVEEKLWKHAYRISNYELDVEPPEGVTLSKAEMQSKPERVDYPHVVKRNRHYGGYIQDMIKKAMSLDSEEKQKEFFAIIGSYMKLAYKTWNRDHYANDEMIRADLKELTGGMYDFIDDISLNLLATVSSSNNYNNHNNQSNRGASNKKGKKKTNKKRFRRKN